MKNSKPIIGILGGIGPESSARFYEELIKKVQENGVKSNLDFPHIILESIPAPELFIDGADLSIYKEALINLEKAGADFIVVVCNTFYTLIDTFRKVANVSIINLAEEVVKELEGRRVKSILILGSRRTADMFGKLLKIKINKMSGEDFETVENIMMEYNRGVRKEEQRKRLLKIIEKYPGQKFLIACTEISMILGGGKKYLDTFDILLNATISRWQNK